MTSPKNLEKARTIFVTVAVVFAFTFFAVVNADAAPGITTLSNQINRLAANAQAIGRTDSSQTINLAIALKLRNQDALAKSIQAMYNPSSPSYHKFLSPGAFDAVYAPSNADYEAVQQFAQLHGLTITGTHANREIIDLSGPASAVEEAFSVHLQNKLLNGRTIYAADADPSLPANIAGAITAIVGLDNAAVRKPADLGVTSAGLSLITGHNGSGPSGSLEPSDILKAYNLNTVSQTGTGQTLALVEFDGYQSTDIPAYCTQWGINQVPLQNVLIDNASGVSSGTGGEFEVTLDIELMNALAPGASKILVYEAPNTDQAGIDMYARIASDDLAKNVSSSWGMAEEYAGSAYMQAEQNAFEQMAAQGQSIYAAAGDSGAYDDGQNLTVDDPASQPYVCGVGGTSLTTSSSHVYTSETTWGYSSEGGGGGISSTWAKPSYQTGFGLSSTKRDVPDVSLDADPNTGYITYTDGNWYLMGGTSCAAPLWAAFTALVNQARVANNVPTLGFPNPTLYTLAQTSSYFTDFHDIADNSTNRYYIANPGYDDATGWGSFNGANMLSDLSTGLTFTPTAPAAPTNVTAVVGTTSTAVSWTASTGATSYNILRSGITAGPYNLIGTSTTTSYTDTTAGTGSSYTYVVSAESGNGISGLSSISGASGTGGAVAPSPLSVNSIGLTSCNLACASIPGAAYYVVGKSLTSGGPYTVNSDPPSYVTTITGLAQGTTYYFVEASVVGGRQSSWSNQAPCTTRLDAPSNPTATADPGGATSIKVTWTGVAASTGYTIKRGLSATGPWTQIGTTTTALTYTDTAISPGVTYWYVIDATKGSVVSFDSGPAVNASAGATAPTGLAAQQQQNYVWVHSSTVVGASSYIFFRGTTKGGPYTQAATATQPSFSDSGAPSGIMVYYVEKAVNGPSKSPYSNEASVLTTPPTPTALTGTASTTGVSLKWTEATGVTATFIIFRATSATSNYAQIGTSAAASYLDTTAAKGATLYYEVAATNSGGTSLNTNYVAVTTIAAAPSTPSGLTATLSGTSVILHWGAVTGATSYNVSRAASPGTTWKAIASPTTNSYTDTSGVPGTIYYYTVSASGPGGSSGTSGTASATIPIAAPTGVSVVASGTTGASVKWSAVTGAISYLVSYSTSATGTYSAGVAATTTSATITGLSAGHTYYVEVKAVGANITSSPIVPASISIPLPSPTGISAIPASYSAINVTWSAVTGASSYTVLRSLNGTTFSAAGTTTTTSFADTGLSGSTKYYYEVTAVASGISSSPSTMTSATTPAAPPSAPGGVTATATSSSAITVSWTAASGATSYTILRSSSSTGTFTSVGTASTTSYSNTGLSASTKYYYEVTANTSAAHSANSSVASATTLAASSSSTKK